MKISWYLLHLGFIELLGFLDSWFSRNLGTFQPLFSSDIFFCLHFSFFLVGRTVKCWSAKCLIGFWDFVNFSSVLFLSVLQISWLLLILLWHLILSSAISDLLLSPSDTSYLWIWYFLTLEFAFLFFFIVSICWYFLFVE